MTAKTPPETAAPVAPADEMPKMLEMAQMMGQRVSAAPTQCTECTRVDWLLEGRCHHCHRLSLR